MYEDLKQLAQLIFMRDVETLSEETRKRTQELRQEYAGQNYTMGVLGSGQQEATIGRSQIQGSVQIIKRLSEIWIDLITKRKGRISSTDIQFIAEELEPVAQSQRQILVKAFAAQRMRGATNLLIQEVNRDLQGTIAGITRNLQIMVREADAFSATRDARKEQGVTEIKKRRFSVGRHVLIGNQAKPAVIISVDDVPREMGEFRHKFQFDRDGTIGSAYGCDIQPFPELDEDLRGTSPGSVHIYIENSTVGNLNLGSQVGTINTALEAISAQGPSSQNFAEALKGLTQATLSQVELADQEKTEIVQALSTIAAEAAKKPDERSNGTLKAVLTWMPTALSVATNLVELWDKFVPLIKAHFGF